MAFRAQEIGRQVGEESDGWICEGCGCSNERACPGGCYWVGKNRCSRCFDADGGRFAVGSRDGLFGMELCPASPVPAAHAPLFVDDVTCYCARCKLDLAA